MGNRCGECGGPSNHICAGGPCADCKRLESLAWAAGFDDAKAGTYDCRPFVSFRMFTAYGHGWGTGRKVAR